MGRLRSVLLVIDDASVGGGQKHVLALAERFAARGVVVAVACEAEGYLVDELRRRSIPHHAVRLPERPSVAGILALARVLRTTKAEIVHTHGGTAGFYGRLAARALGTVKTVHTYHGIHYLHDRRVAKRFLHRAVDRFLLRWTDEIICVAESDLRLALAERLAHDGRVSVVYNGIDLASFQRVRVPRLANDTPCVVGTVGRLHEQKGHSVLLHAAREIRAHIPEIRFRIIGEGPLEQELRKQAKELGVSDIVEFLGARNDIPEQLHTLDLFVLPSLWEGLPYVLMEAMAAGLPVLATDVDGVREMLADGTDGRIVPPRDPHLLASAILELVHNPAQREAIAVAGRETVRRRFSVEAMVDHTLAVYERAMNA